MRWFFAGSLPSGPILTELSRTEHFKGLQCITHFLFLYNLAMKHSQGLAALSKAPLQLLLYKLPGSIRNLLRNFKVIAE
jgi:hypothetical protein